MNICLFLKNRRNIFFFVIMKEESEELFMDYYFYIMEEVVKWLKVLKLIVYDLIKKGEFFFYRVGR